MWDTFHLLPSFQHQRSFLPTWFLSRVLHSLQVPEQPCSTYWAKYNCARLVHTCKKQTCPKYELQGHKLTPKQGHSDGMVYLVSAAPYNRFCYAARRKCVPQAGENSAVLDVALSWVGAMQRTDAGLTNAQCWLLLSSFTVLLWGDLPSSRSSSEATGHPRSDRQPVCLRSGWATLASIFEGWNWKWTNILPSA